jgi:nitrate/nitrite transporter NarK
MALLLPISIIVLNLGMPICNIPQLQFSNRLTTLISIVGICLSVLSMSFCNQFWHFLVLYGIVFGLFIGYGYMAPIKNCYQHIPELKGTFGKMQGCVVEYAS